MNNQFYQNQEMEIDIKELCWDLLSQWKAVFIVCLLMAVLVSGAKYIKDNSSYQASVDARKEAQEEISRPEADRIEDALKGLSADEVADVNYVLEMRKMIRTQQKYLDTSVLLLQDPSNQKTLKINYLIKSDSGTNMLTLCDAYSTLLYRKDFISGLRDIMVPDKELEYAYDLLSTSEKTDVDSLSDSTIYTLDIVLPDDCDTDRIIKYVDSAVNDFSSELDKSIGSHSIQLANAENVSVYNQDAAERKRDILNDINYMKNNLKNTEASLSDEQKLAVEAIDTIKNQSEATEKDIIKDENAELLKPGLSKKYLLIGFVLGGFLYVFCYVVYVMLKGCVSSASMIEDYTDSRLLGGAYYKGERKGLATLLHSDLVEKIRYKGWENLDTQISRIEKSMEALCAHADAMGVTMIKLVDTDKLLPVKDILASISHAVSKEGIKNEEINAIGEFEEKTLLGISNAVFIIGKDTKISKLGELLRLCRDYDINILGSIYVSEM